MSITLFRCPHSCEYVRTYTAHPSTMHNEFTRIHLFLTCLSTSFPQWATTEKNHGLHGLTRRYILLRKYSTHKNWRNGWLQKKVYT